MKFLDQAAIHKNYPLENFKMQPTKWFRSRKKSTGSETETKSVVEPELLESLLTGYKHAHTLGLERIKCMSTVLELDRQVKVAVLNSGLDDCYHKSFGFDFLSVVALARHNTQRAKELSRLSNLSPQVAEDINETLGYGWKKEMLWLHLQELLDAAKVDALSSSPAGPTVD